MASRPFIILSLLSYLTLFSSLSPTSSASRASPSRSSDKVSLGVYYETLCPYSANFIINYLVKIFEDGLITIVDLNLVPFGNAKIRGSNTIDCQILPGITSDGLCLHGCNASNSARTNCNMSLLSPTEA